MSNPILCYMVPTNGLRISMKFDRDGLSDPTDYGGLRDYEIRNLDEVDGLADAAATKNLDLEDPGYSLGTISPLDKVSLPPNLRKAAGVPQTAKYFAFAHPPPKLLDLFGDYEDVLKHRDEEYNGSDDMSDSAGSKRWSRGFGNILGKSGHERGSDHMLQSDEGSSSDAASSRMATALFAKFGAFFYFSKDKNVIGINVVSFKKSRYKMRLGGPFEASKIASKELISAGRVVESKLPQNNECGFIGMGWLRPHETFGGNTASPLIPCKNGGFVFYKDNGDAIIYAIRQNQNDLSEYLKSGSDFIADANECLLEQKKLTFYSGHIRLDDHKECRKRVISALKDCGEGTDIDDINLKKLARLDLEGAFPILHQALKCRFELSDIQKIVGKYGGLDQVDMYGWRAIHYGARFYAHDEKVIEYLLLNSDEDILMQTDGLDRYPLHIACDSKPSEKVIHLLMKKEFGGDGILYKKTKYLELLPIHIACNGKASKEVIEALLDADKTGKTIRMKTAVGRLPLHIALFNSMSYDTIDALVDAESDLVATLSAADSTSDSIYQWDHGMLPIHIACLNGADSNVLKLLVDRDVSGETLFKQLRKREEVSDESKHTPGHSTIRNALLSTSDNDDTLETGTDDIVYTDDDDDSRYLDDDTGFLSGMRCLHVCLLTKSAETCRVLLQAEKQYSHRDGASSKTRRKRAEMTDDLNGRTCLHWACMNNCEADIVELLIVLDPYRSAVKMQDKYGSTPLHLACNQKAAKKEVIEALLNTEISNAEDDNNVLGLSVLSTSSWNLENRGRWPKSWLGLGNKEQMPSETVDDLNRNPLSLAVKSSVSPDVLELMMQPEHFDMNGFDDRAIDQLATRIKNNTKLQKSLVLSLAERIPFFIYIIQAYAWIAAVCVALYGTHTRFLEENDEQEWIVGMMSIAAVIFFARELIQICSEKWNYIFDFQNLFELANLFFFVWSIVIFKRDEMIYDDTTRLVLLASSILLIINFIFFLRSTMLPFSRFVGGVVMIFSTLVPFLVVSLMLLLMFTFIYRIQNSHLEYPVDDNVTSAHGFLMMVKKKKASNVEGSLAEKCQDSDGDSDDINVFTQCFKAVLGAFFGGGTDSIYDMPDLFFGLFIVLVLLNVVIAIVSDAWEDAKDQATNLFWKGRLNFLLESRSAIMLITKKNDSWLSWIDNIPTCSFKSPTISWTRDHPYCLVKSINEYQNPKDYFSPDIAEQIDAVKCLSTDYRWLKLREDDEDDRAAYVLSTLKWIGCFALNLFFLILGLFTCGILWSTDQRVSFFSFGNEEEDREEEEEDEKDEELEMLREENEKLTQSLEKLQAEADKWKNQASSI